MVTKWERVRQPFAKRLGLVRVSSQELVDILKKHAKDGSASARTKRYEFSSIDDMEENIELLSGQTKVYLRVEEGSENKKEIEINFAACTTLSERWLSENAATEIEKLARDLKLNRYPLVSHLTRLPQLFWAVLLCVLIWLLPSKGDTIPAVIPAFSERANLILWLTSIAVCALAYLLTFLPPVFYNPKQTFWQKNRDTILVGVLMLIIGYFTSELRDLLSEGSGP